MNKYLNILGRSTSFRLAKKSARRGKTAADDPVIRDRIVQMIVRRTGFIQANRRSGVKGLIDHPMRIPLQVKLVSRNSIQKSK